jgi:GTP-binding protein Era
MTAPEENIEPTSDQKCGLVAVLGAPNAGKSTLVNQLVGQKVAITSPKKQTTRARLLGIAIQGRAQIMLVDTPGIFDPNRRFDRAMVSAAWEGAQGADVTALVVDARAKLNEKVGLIAERLKDQPGRRILLLNKVDIAAKGQIAHSGRGTGKTGAILRKCSSSARSMAKVLTNCATGWPMPCRYRLGISPKIRSAMPANGYWRAKSRANRFSASFMPNCLMPASLSLKNIPNALMARSKFTSRSSSPRPTQRAIVLGKGGAQIKEIGARARAELTELLGPQGPSFPACQSPGRMG